MEICHLILVVEPPECKAGRWNQKWKSAACKDCKGSRAATHLRCVPTSHPRLLHSLWLTWKKYEKVWKIEGLTVWIVLNDCREKCTCIKCQPPPWEKSGGTPTPSVRGLSPWEDRKVTETRNLDWAAQAALLWPPPIKSDLQLLNVKCLPWKFMKYIAWPPHPLLLPLPGLQKEI